MAHHSLDAHWLDEFLRHHGAHDRLDPSAVHCTTVWLFRLGFNLLRTSMSELRQVPVEASCSREFDGYVGGPVLGDPMRNGRVLLEVLVLLENGDGAEEHRANDASQSSKQRTEYATAHLVQLLRRRAGGHGASLDALHHFAPLHLLHVLARSQVAVPDADYLERTAWDKLFRLGVVGAELMNPKDLDRISSGEVLHQWLALAHPSRALAQGSVGRTRKTCVATMERILGELGVRLPHGQGAARIHDGDYRLFFRAVELVPEEVFARALEGLVRKENPPPAGVKRTLPQRVRAPSQSSPQPYFPRKPLGNRANDPSPQSRFWSPSAAWSAMDDNSRLLD